MSHSLLLETKKKELKAYCTAEATVSRALSMSAIRDGVKRGQSRFIPPPLPPSFFLRRAPRSLGSAPRKVQTELPVLSYQTFLTYSPLHFLCLYIYYVLYILRRASMLSWLTGFQSLSKADVCAFLLQVNIRNRNREAVWESISTARNAADAEHHNLINPPGALWSSKHSNMKKKTSVSFCLPCIVFQPVSTSKKKP